jgi:GNAT superfamily N-acetyltransferase
MTTFELRPLERGDWPALSKLFGAKGACGGCWCMWWRVPRGGKLWEESKGEPNRRAMAKLVKAGRVHGILAFADGEPVGWCCVGPRADFPRLERTKAFAGDWDAGTWSVTCFYVPARWRRQGLAGKLLDAVVDLARELGARNLEGYPVKPARGAGASVPATFAWTGVEPLFERRKFKARGDRGATRNVFVRKLRAPRG